MHFNASVYYVSWNISMLYIAIWLIFFFFSTVEPIFFLSFMGQIWQNFTLFYLIFLFVYLFSGSLCKASLSRADFTNRNVEGRKQNSFSDQGENAATVVDLNEKCGSCKSLWVWQKVIKAHRTHHWRRLREEIKWRELNISTYYFTKITVK